MNARLSVLRPLLWLLLLVAATWALRAPFLHREQWNLDEGVTFTIAQQIREGGVLYQDAVDHRSPLVPYLKAAVFAVAGDWNIYAVHFVLTLALGGVAFLLYDLSRRLGHAAVGAWGAGAFVLLSLVLPGAYDSLAAHTEWFVVCFSALGFWCFARVVGRGGFLAGIPIGLAFGASALCKQPGLLDFGVTWVLLAFLALAAPAQRPRALRLWLGSVIGVAACFAAAFFYFWRHGVLRDFIYYGWTYNTKIYVPEIPTLTRLKAIHLPFTLAWQYLPAALTLALGGALSIGTSLLRGRFSILPWLILGWSASGIISCALSGRIFDHYVIQSVPGFSLAVGWMLARLTASVSATESRRWRRALASVVLLSLGAWVTVDAVRFFKKIDPTDDPAHAEVARVIQRYSTRYERILSWGYYPEAHLISRRLPATRFVYSNFLTGMVPWTNLALEVDTHYAVVPGAWDAFWRDYREHQPVLITEAVMRGYLKYPLLGQPLLRDELIDHFASVEPDVAEKVSLNLYRRLVPVVPTLPAAEVDAQLALHPRRIRANPDIVAVIVRGPATGGAVTLRVGGRAYRRIELPRGAPVNVGFFVRVADLAAPGANLIGAVLERPGLALASPSLDLVRRLALDVLPAEPVPIIDYSIRRLTALSAPDPARWHAEPRGEALGWRTSAPFSLEFERPASLALLRFEWQPPRGSTAVPELLLASADGAAMPLAPTFTPTDHDTQLATVQLPPDRAGKLTLRWRPPTALAQSEVWLGRPLGFAPGPGLDFRDRSLPPSVADHSAAGALQLQPDGSWLAPAPFRLLYPRLEPMNAIVVDYGFIDRAYTDPAAKPGEVMLEVNFVHEDGRRENLLSDLIRPRLEPQSRGRHTRRVGLPAAAAGEIEIKCGNVVGNASPDNQLYLFPPRIQGPGPDLVIDSQRILTPTESETVSGDPIRVCVDGRWVAHAPGHLVYRCPADLRTVNFGFGIDERAYWGDNGEMRSNGIDVSVEFRDENEQSTELYRRRLDPRMVVADRGAQHARIELPGKPGRLVFHFAPGPNNDAAYDWSYWTDFTGEVITPPASR